MRTTYLTDPATPITEAALAWWERGWNADRAWGAYSGDRCVGTLRTFPTTLTVPSAGAECAQIAADALTQVSVSGTHRRQGILSEMLTRSLADAHDRGELVSVLRAAEWPIYGRYGYSCTARASTYKVRVEPRPHILAPIDPVTLVQVEPAELADPAGGGPGPEVLARRRRQQPGHIDRDHSFWERILGLNGLAPNSKAEPVCVLATDSDGNHVGYAIWTARQGDWFEEKVEVTLHELITVTDDAYRALWAYLINLDLVKSINWAEQAPDEPLEWLLDDGRAARQDWTYDDLWLRILDTPGALSARRYSVEDALILQVVDDDASGWGAGRYLLDGGPHHAACTPAGGRSADLQLSQRALAAVYLSGQTLLSQAAAGLVDEQTPGALRRLELMLAEPRSPWNSTQF